MAKRRPAPRASVPKAEAGQIHYVESSALVSALVEEDAEVLAELRAASRLVTSALTRAEAMRAIRRARNAGRVSADEERRAVRAVGTFIRRCHIVQVDAVVLSRVGRPFPVEPIRTLDAIHVATAERLDESPQLITVVSRDDRVRANAAALGYQVRPTSAG